MIALLIYAVASIGLAYIVGQSEISYGLRGLLAETGSFGRWLVLMVECPVCFGTWTGLLAGLLINPLRLQTNWVFVMVITACFTAGSNLLFARLAGIGVPGVTPDKEEG